MKPCFRNRKPLTLLTLGLLADDQAQALRAHLQSCDGCRQYAAEISHVMEKLSLPNANAEVEPSEAFHRRVVGRIRSEPSASGWARATGSMRAVLGNWRVALPVLVTCSVVIAVLFTGSHRGGKPPTPPNGSQVDIAAAVNDLAPSLANYQVAANQSLEQLDRLLTSQANRTHRALRAYSASAGLATAAAE